MLKKKCYKTTFTINVSFRKLYMSDSFEIKRSTFLTAFMLKIFE